jgi:hypothetical protein
VWPAEMDAIPALLKKIRLEVYVILYLRRIWNLVIIWCVKCEKCLALYLAFRLIDHVFGVWNLVWWYDLVKILYRSLDLASRKVCDSSRFIISILGFKLSIVRGTIAVHNIGCTSVLCFDVWRFRSQDFKFVFLFEVHIFWHLPVPLSWGLVEPLLTFWSQWCNG